MAQFTTEVDQLAKELSWLRQEFDGIKGVVNGWTGGAGTDPYFQYLRARDGFFDKPILETALARRQSTQTIPDATGTGIQWLETNVNSGLITLSTITNSSRIYMAPIVGGQDQLMFFTGFVDWEGNSSGERNTILKTYRSDDSSIGGFVMHRENNSSLTFISHTWSFALRHNSSNAYITLEVTQNSGANLGLTQARISFMIGS
jgi:hypothetical protein